MPCAECEALPPGAKCQACVSTLLYLLEQDEAIMENLWGYIREQPKTRCDGNHAAITPCSDPACWQRDAEPKPE